MAGLTHPKPAVGVSPPRASLRVVESRPRSPRLHLFTYVVGSALVWTIWAAVSVSAEPWYWWPIVPAAGWALVVAALYWTHRVSRREASQHVG